MGEASLRLDKWLWFARFFKSRSLATKFCQSGKLRVNGDVVKKAHYSLRPGDVLTFPKGPHVRVVKVLDLGKRRGPAIEAQSLYEDLQPPQPKAPPSETVPEAAAPRRDAGTGRPTKRDRRAVDRLRGWWQSLRGGSREP